MLKTGNEADDARNQEKTFNFTTSSRFLELQVTSKTAEMLMHEKM